MKISLMYFAALREALDLSEEVIEFSLSQMTGQELLDELSKRYPQAVDTLQSCTLAQDMQYTALGEPIQPGVQVALIPPVSGG